MHAFDRPTDGRTDRRTDRNLIVKTALHSMQRGKNCVDAASANVLVLSLKLTYNCRVKTAEDWRLLILLRSSTDWFRVLSDRQACDLLRRPARCELIFG